MLVELRDVVSFYRLPGRTPVKALDKAEIAVSRGEVVGLLGLNGAGKTTLMRVMLGLMHADSGYISVLGLDPTKQRHTLLRLCGAVIDGQRELPPRWTPMDLLRYVGISHGLPDRVIRARADELLERFGLIEVKNRIINSFSRGMKQKLSLLVALIHQPSLLVLDEPTLGLDVEATQELLGHIRSVAARGSAVLVSSHQLSLVEQIASRVVVIHKGRTIFGGSPEALVRYVGHGRVALEFEELDTRFAMALLERARVTGRQVSIPLELESLEKVVSLARLYGMKLIKIDKQLDFESAYLALLEERREDVTLS